MHSMRGCRQGEFFPEYVEEVKAQDIIKQNFRVTGIQITCKDYQIINLISRFVHEFSVVKTQSLLDEIVCVIQSGEVDWNRILILSHDTPMSSYIYLLVYYLHKQQYVAVDSFVLKSLRYNQVLLSNIGVYLLSRYIGKLQARENTNTQFQPALLARLIWVALLSDKPALQKCLCFLRCLLNRKAKNCTGLDTYCYPIE